MSFLFSHFRNKNLKLLCRILNPEDKKIISLIRNKKLFLCIIRIQYITKPIYSDKCNFKAHKTDVLCLIKISNIQIASSSDDNDNLIKIWELPKGVCVKTLYGHNDKINLLLDIKYKILSSQVMTL